MQTIQEIANLKPSLTERCYDDILSKRVWFYNAVIGNLTGYDCKVCKNKGNIAVIKDGAEIMQECECMNIRRSVFRIEKSGLKNLLQEYTFEKYDLTELWQKKAKEVAQRFLNDYKSKWFYMGGQVGSGKSHLCTAIVGDFLNRGFSAKYMLWRDEIVQLKANVNDDTAYSGYMDTLKTTKVLYIDDFFKTEKDKSPTAADVNIAFELINYRYNNKDLITIISSEKSIDDLIFIDEAVGSRIYQRTKDFCMHIGLDRRKNFRLK